MRKELHTHIFGQRPSFLTQYSFTWTDPNAEGFKAVQGWSFFPVKGLDFSQPPTLFIDGHFEAGTPAHVIDPYGWGGYRQAALISWVLVFSPSGENDKFHLIDQGQFKMDGEGKLYGIRAGYTGQGSDSIYVRTKVDNFDTGHIALWAKCEYIDYTPDISRGFPVASFKDKLELYVLPTSYQPPPPPAPVRAIDISKMAEVPIPHKEQVAAGKTMQQVLEEIWQ